MMLQFTNDEARDNWLDHK